MLERAVKCMNEKCHCLDIRLLWFSAKWAKPEMWLSWKGKPKKKIACRPRVSLIQDNNVSSGFYGYHKANLNNFSYCLIRWSDTASYIWATFLKWTTIWHGANPLTLAPNEIRSIYRNKMISAISSLWQLCPIIVFLCHVELNENDNFDIRKGLYFNKTLPKAQRTQGLSSYHRISIKH